MGVIALFLCITLAGALVVAGIDVEQLPAEGVPPVEEHRNQVEVDQPVTAVLLAFRGYDTWLELGVLFAAVLGFLTLRRSHKLKHPEHQRTDQVLDVITRLLVPVMVLIAGFLLWAGTRIPGGAFQAGAILAGAGVMLHVAGINAFLIRLMRGRPLRLLAVFALMLFLLVGIGTLLSGRALLEYPEGWGGDLIFLLEAGVMISVGWTLAFAYMAATPPPGSGGEE